MGAGEKTGSLVAMNDVLLRGFCGGLLELLNSFSCFGGLPFFDEGLPVAFEGFDVRLQARVAGGTAMVLTQIFDGGVFIWHRECEHTIERRYSRQYRAISFLGARAATGPLKPKGQGMERWPIDGAKEVSLYLRHVSIVQRDRTRDS